MHGSFNIELVLAISGRFTLFNKNILTTITWLPVVKAHL